MPVDYSKWDALELSDDSDIEVHPNVDKRSFIRAKQNQIHEQRLQRKHDIATYKYERIINDGLLERIDALLTALRKHADDTRNPDELVFQALIESAGDPAKDEPPKPPEGVYTKENKQPKYSEMMGSLVDQVKKEVDEGKSPNRYEAYLSGVNGHLTKVQDLQQQLLVKLAELEKEEGSKITSESIHTGFDSSHVAKSKPGIGNQPSAKEKIEAVEVLNPAALKREPLQRSDTNVSSGAEADIEDGSLKEDEEDVKLSPLGKRFAQIKSGDYRALLQFISENPDIVAEEQTDGLLVEAFNAQMDGKEVYARTCVHHGLLLQYCRSLGRDGVGLFFKRITTKDHQAQKVFSDDVNQTYGRIKTRAAELQKESGKDPAGVEQIQLHAVDADTKIHIVVPQPDSEDATEKASREIFERFPPGLQRALESASLEEVNKVLGKMSVEEAEEVVEQLGQGGMLSLEQGVIDATTEEGQQRLKRLEEENQEKRGVTEEMPDVEEATGEGTGLQAVVEKT
ncbi:MAG: hypothetical protein Q9227_003139 [Pyrenula ochraceoflavens]